MKLFGNSGIRGIVGEKITPDLALSVGKAIGTIANSIIIGRDPRLSGLMIQNALVSGIIYTGCNVILTDIVTTPTLALASTNHDYGIMITASHNPKEYNGIKIFNKNTSPINQEKQAQIEQIMNRKEYKHNINKYGTILYEHNASMKHIQKIIHRLGTKLERQLKVVVDCGGGSASTITPYLLNCMGYNVISINSHLDGTFSSRESEPRDDTLTELKKIVTATDADIGIAHDGDSDRMVAITPLGEMINSNRLLYLFSIPYKNIVLPIDASSILNNLNSKKNICKVGDSFVANHIIKTKAQFGGEPSGAYIFPEISFCPDGVFAAAKLCKMIEHETIFCLLKDIPTTDISQYRYTYYKQNKTKLIKEIYKELINTYPQATLSKEDIIYNSTHMKFIIRPSGTENNIIFTIEPNIKKCKEHIESIIIKAVS